MLSAGVWRQLFMITDNTYERLALEVLATFELSRRTVSFHHANTIQFQVFGTLHQMSLIEFSIRLGIYDAEFTQTLVYDSLLISRSIRESQEFAQWRLSTDPTYDPRLSKATTLRSHALRYIHIILSQTLTGHGDSTSIVSFLALRYINFLLSILYGFQLHLWLRWSYLLPIRGQTLESVFSSSARTCQGDEHSRWSRLYVPRYPEVNGDVAVCSHC